MSRVLVLAGNQVEFDDWKRRTMPGASKYDVRYLSSTLSIEGMQLLYADDFVLVGTWYERRDLVSIMRILDATVVRYGGRASPQVRHVVNALLGREPL